LKNAAIHIHPHHRAFFFLKAHSDIGRLHAAISQIAAGALQLLNAVSQAQIGAFFCQSACVLWVLPIRRKKRND
jgi:hypothetical protein